MGWRPASTSIIIPSDKRAMRNDELCSALRQLIEDAWDLDPIDVNEIIDEVERRLGTPFDTEQAKKVLMKYREQYPILNDFMDKQCQRKEPRMAKKSVKKAKPSKKAKPVKKC